MNALTAVTTGFGIGLASVGGLWLTIRWSAGCRHMLVVMALSQMLRLSLAAAGLYAVSREGPGFLVPALAGFWMARRIMIRRWGGLRHARD